MNLMIVDDHLLIRAGMKLPERIHLSVKTVDTHKKHIYEKLDCSRRSELVTLALRYGLLQ